MARRRVGEGVGAAQEKADRARALRRAMTLAERHLWEALRRSALGVRVRQQHVIHGWIVDFYVPAKRLVIEVDGGIHDGQVDDDMRREEGLYAEGLVVVRVRNDEVLGALTEVLDRIRAAMASR